jgi:hypothetical protein
MFFGLQESIPFPLPSPLHSIHLQIIEIKVMGNREIKSTDAWIEWLDGWSDERIAGKKRIEKL